MAASVCHVRGGGGGGSSRKSCRDLWVPLLHPHLSLGTSSTHSWQPLVPCVGSRQLVVSGSAGWYCVHTCGLLQPGSEIIGLQGQPHRVCWFCAPSGCPDGETESPTAGDSWTRLPAALLPVPSCLVCKLCPSITPNPPGLLGAPPVAPSLPFLQSCVGGGLCGPFLSSVRATVAG